MWFDKSASDLYFVISTKQNERIWLTRSKYTVEMSICQAENVFLGDELLKKLSYGFRNDLKIFQAVFLHIC